MLEASKLERKIVRVAIDGIGISADKLYDYLAEYGQWSRLHPGMRVAVPFGKGNTMREAMVLMIVDDYKRDDVKLKFIGGILDSEPVLDAEAIRLAAHLRQRLHCTYYSIVRAMLPAGIWYKLQVRYAASGKLMYYDSDDAVNEDEIALLEVLKSSSEPMNIAELETLVPSFSEKTLKALIAKGFVDTIAEADSSVKDKTAKMLSLSEDAYELFDNGECSHRNKPQKKVLEFLYSSGSATAKEIMYYTGVSDSPIKTLVKKGLLTQAQIEVFRRPEFSKTEKMNITLNESQNTAYSGLKSLIDSEKSSTALLYGVTGSGKTLVYIKLIEHVLSLGKTAMMLVPEISLTPQMMTRFYAQFGDCVAVIHSALSVGERYDEWKRIRSGQARVVVGTRSAVFASMKNIGLVVIDEEHEHTFKSEEPPRYHARDVAKYICYRNNALLLLGSATPSVETTYRAKTGEYAFFSMESRYGGAKLPQVIISDMRNAFSKGYSGVFGPELLELLTETKNSGCQAVLMLNRRGTSKSVRCMECGFVPVCDNCSVSLSYHGENGRMICHQCGYSVPRIVECPQCGGKYMEQVGIGTQEAERELEEKIPGIRLIRMDSDSTMRKDSHTKLLEKFGKGGADVLIGTQMIAKGLDFEDVTLSGVLDADMMLYTGDYKGAENAFALMMQVAGRSGRHEKKGIALIQTMTPENSVIQAVQEQDYWAFYESEIHQRKLLKLPPFYNLWRFTVSGMVVSDVMYAAKDLKIMLSELCREKYSEHNIEVLGPAPAEIFKLNNRYRYIVTLRLHDNAELRNMAEYVLSEANKNRKVSVYVDIYY